SISYGGKPAILGNVMDITELKEARDRLEEMEALEASILDAIPHAVLGVVDRHVVFANNATESVLGWKPEELIRRSTRILYETEEDYEEIGRAFYGVEKKRFFVEQIPCRKRDGEIIICRVSASRIGDSREEKKVVVVYEDITEKVKMDEALHEERDRAQQYLDIAGAIILAIDQHGTVMLINQRGAEILRYAHDEIVGRNWFDTFVPKRIKHEVKSIFFRLIAGNVDPVEYVENPILTREGKERIISWHNSVIQDEEGNVVGILSSGEDITERKRAEEKLFEHSEKLRLMSSELSLTEQRERQRIATELHDRIGQSMAISKIKLEELKRDLLETGFKRPVDEIIAIMDQLIYDTRSLTFELSPPVLFILGLDAALEWLAEQFQEKHGIRVTFQREGAGQKLDKDIAFVLFRSTQELLINIVKHSRADFVSIIMKTSRGKIQINVKDNGIGFDPKKIEMPADSKGGFGIFSIRERLNYLGGQFRVEAKPGRGSNVTMVVPSTMRRSRKKRTSL
ncbi:MAG: PAS domain S-box protein, partial [Deltaproteobacteria bacterium]|nr:PAS domain S-box protein [Deltaproteobacteria bacterium]